MGTAVYRNAALPRHATPAHRIEAAAPGRVDVCRLAASLIGLTVYLGVPTAGLVYLGLAATRWFAGA